MTIKIYLAGCMGEWRKILMKLLTDSFPNEIVFLEPKFDSSSIVNFVTKDLEMISNADLILCLINYPVYTGAMFECGYAFAMSIPIITIFELKDRIDPFLIGTSIAVFNDLQSSIDKIKRTIRSLIK